MHLDDKKKWSKDSHFTMYFTFVNMLKNVPQGSKYGILLIYLIFYYLRYIRIFIILFFSKNIPLDICQWSNQSKTLTAVRMTALVKVNLKPTTKCRST